MLLIPDWIETPDHWRLHWLHACPRTPRFPQPILCIHGFSQSHLTFTAGGMLQSLAEEGLYAYALDLRGHGGSAVRLQSPPLPADLHYRWNTNTFLFQDIPAALAALQQKHPNQPVVLCGHSMGGLLSLATALRIPQRIAGLVILGSPIDVAKMGLHIRTLGQLLSRIHRQFPSLQDRWSALPMRRLFQLLDQAYHTSTPNLSMLLPWLLRYDQNQIWPQLWHPELTNTDTVREMLQQSYPETMGVVHDFMRWAAHGTLDFGHPQRRNDIPLFHTLSLPIVGAWGEQDILAPPKTADLLYRSLRRSPHLERLHLPKARHLDITAGKPIHQILPAILKLYQSLPQP